jgi:hypothetical protein
MYIIIFFVLKIFFVEKESEQIREGEMKDEGSGDWCT